ncbi:MAG TPA: hypothetical protein VF384_06950 [Planctomycetota bacterium]
MRSMLFVAALGVASSALAQMPLPAFSYTYTVPWARGFWFQAPINFAITGLAVPNEALQAQQVVEVIDFGTSPPPVFPFTATGTTLFYSNGTAAGSLIPVSIPIVAGHCIGILGACTPGTGTGLSTSMGPSMGPFASDILGIATTITMLGTQFDIATAGAGNPCWQDPYPYNPLARVQVHVAQTGTGTIATNTTLGAGCVRSNASMYENFEWPHQFDLANTALTFAPNGSGGYVASLAGSFLPVGSTSTPTPLTLGDDDEITQMFTVGSFPGWTAMTICSNGFISKAPGNGIWWLLPHQMLSMPQTAFYATHDYSPTSTGSGRIVWEESASRIVVTWNGVYSYGSTAASHVQFQFYPTGTVTIAFGAMSGLGNGHLVGYSPEGPNHDPGNTDISALGTGTIAIGATDLLPLTLAATTRPFLGTWWPLATTNIPPSGVLGVDIFGLGDPAIADLGFLGMPGCGLRSTLDVMRSWTVAGALHIAYLGIPNSTTVLGVDVFTTSAVFQVPAVNAFGAITSNGIRGHIGNL